MLKAVSSVGIVIELARLFYTTEAPELVCESNCISKGFGTHSASKKTHFLRIIRNISHRRET